VQFEEGENFAKDNGLLFLETSAKTGDNVIEVTLLRMLIYIYNLDF